MLVIAEMVDDFLNDKTTNLVVQRVGQKSKLRRRAGTSFTGAHGGGRDDEARTGIRLMPFV